MSEKYDISPAGAYKILKESGITVVTHYTTLWSDIPKTSVR